MILIGSIISVEYSDVVQLLLPTDLPAVRMVHDNFVLGKLTEIFLTCFPIVIFLIALFIFGRLPGQAEGCKLYEEVGTVVRSHTQLDHYCRDISTVFLVPCR